jgi:hypothetical protein
MVREYSHLSTEVSDLTEIQTPVPEEIVSAVSSGEAEPVGEFQPQPSTSGVAGDDALIVYEHEHFPSLMEGGKNSDDTDDVISIYDFFIEGEKIPVGAEEEICNSFSLDSMSGHQMVESNGFENFIIGEDYPLPGTSSFSYLEASGEEEQNLGDQEDSAVGTDQIIDNRGKEPTGKNPTYRKTSGLNF